MTEIEIENLIVAAGQNAAKGYRLVQERAGTLYYVPASDKPPLLLSPFEHAVTLPGAYRVAFVDANGKNYFAGPRLEVVVEPLCPVGNDSAALAQSGASPIEKEADEVGHSLELEKLNADTLRVRGSAHAFTENLSYYAAFQRALGTQSSTELRIKNEQIDLLAKASMTLLETQAKLMESWLQHSEKLKPPPTPPPPPPPPNWEKIIAAGAPALASMYTATIAAITKTAPVKVSGLAEPIAPESEKLKHLYEALGNVASNERLEAMLKDEAKLAEWLKLVRNFIKDAADQEPSDPE